MDNLVPRLFPINQEPGNEVAQWKAKSAIFGPLSALVKDSRQIIKREKRLLKVVTVNFSLYKQLQY